MTNEMKIDNGIDTRDLQLNLVVRDPEVVQELSQIQPGPERENRATSALRIGILALRQASGGIDTAALHQEGQRLMDSLKIHLSTHALKFENGLQSSLQKYFDPEGGMLPKRLQDLVKKNGELDLILTKHIDGDMSALAQTIDSKIGPESPFLRLLSPTQSDGLLAILNNSLTGSLEEQRKIILEQFSLDDKTSALSKLISNVTDANGELKTELAKDLTKMQSEFSLDNPDGALSRLVTYMQSTNKNIDQKLTLDDEDSPLSRLQQK